MLTLGAKAAEGNLAARVVLLANSADADSLRVARHYAEVRGVPLENIIALKLPLAESITWREFVVALWEPLRRRLLAVQLVRPLWADPALGRSRLGRSRLVAVGFQGESASPPLAEALSAKGQLPGDGARACECVRERKRGEGREGGGGGRRDIREDFFNALTER